MMVYHKYIAVILISVTFLGNCNVAVAQDKNTQQSFPVNCEIIKPEIVTLGLNFDGLNLTSKQYNEVREIVNNTRLNICRIYGAISQQENKRVNTSLNSSGGLTNIFQYQSDNLSIAHQKELFLVIKSLKDIIAILNKNQINQIRQQLPYIKALSDKHIEYVQFERLRSVYYGSLLGSEDLNLALFLQSIISQGFKEEDHLYYPRSQIETALLPLQITSQQQEEIIKLLKLNYLTEYKHYQIAYGLIFELLDNLLSQTSEEQSIKFIQSQIELQYTEIMQEKTAMLSKFWEVLTLEQKQQVKEKMRSSMKKN